VKVAIYLKNNVNPSVGGNFSYHEKFIGAVDNYNFTKTLEICFVGRFGQEKVQLQKNYFRLAPAFLYKLSDILIRLKIKTLFKRVFGVNIDLCAHLDARILKSNNIEIVLFPIQFLKAVNDFPFITMNWDAGHKTTFAFPELIEHFEFRERWYHSEIQEAMAIFVESETSKKEFCTYYAVPPHKIEVIPLFAGSVVDLTVEEKIQVEILSRLNLEKHNFLYYPAQFWAHKNHYNLLIAFKEVVSSSTGKNMKLVLSGSDMGNKDYVISIIKKENLENNVLVLGFISNQEVYTLYKNAVALVMPTFLGPTNMPLLEAQALGTAVICSNLDGHREQCGHTALYADPSKPDQWAGAMLSILNPETRSSLIKAADQYRATSPFTIQKALEHLEKAFMKFSSIRKTFQ